MSQRKLAGGEKMGGVLVGQLGASTGEGRKIRKRRWSRWRAVGEGREQVGVEDVGRQREKEKVRQWGLGGIVAAHILYSSVIISPQIIFIC